MLVIYFRLHLCIYVCLNVVFIHFFIFFYCSHLMENQISNVERGAFDELKELERL